MISIISSLNNISDLCWWYNYNAFCFFKSTKSQSWFFALYSGTAVDPESSKPLSSITEQAWPLILAKWLACAHSFAKMESLKFLISISVFPRWSSSEFIWGLLKGSTTWNFTFIFRRWHNLEKCFESPAQTQYLPTKFESALYFFITCSGQLRENLLRCVSESYFSKPRVSRKPSCRSPSVSIKLFTLWCLIQSGLSCVATVQPMQVH